ncbi:hypothetical protein QA639_21420 [Bradyrhizobium pachyrhizi]|uniref:hypothetical protein n=1 Tax=Bradyrhizobium pachyrhizi TaxID=280333 RepID=UPI0024B1E064|nr:hypothetical protein [Bradyrhizobium pachyrhizi]WFU52271.1 hypothetical protein QA639_21420 [Bradyrhizobium pachyrhizi]
MKRAFVFGISILLTGCASEPPSAEQRQFAAQWLLAQQARQTPPPQPYYMPTTPAPTQRPTNCITNQVGNSLYTNCN